VPDDAPNDPPTRDRILDGAVDAAARHGLAKLGMGDVSVSAAVSRGTVYRYFPNRRALLRALARREGRRFQERVAEAVRGAPPAERIRVAIEHATRHAREHPVLRRIVDTDPAFVLQALRREYPAIRATIHDLLAPLLRDTEPVRRGIASEDQLVDWLTRVMISAFLLPDPSPDEMTRGLTAIYRLLSPADEGRRDRPTPRRAR
jgi:TetR/AcrR family transcriptional regulator, repressor for uid operon